MSVAVQPQNLGQKNRSIIRLVPPWFIESGLYVNLLYEYALVPIVGVEIPRLGIVFMAGLAALSFLSFRERAVDFFRALVFPIGLGISYLIIQLMYHGGSILTGYVKPFVPWIFTLIVVQALFLRRGFFHRFAIFALILGSLTLPFLESKVHGEGLTRVLIEEGPLSSSNDLGNWFGWCTVYFFAFGVASQRQKTRLTSWIIATGCLAILMLTVSRTALIAAVIGIVLASREFLKRGFLPVILLVMLAGIAYGTGIFDQAISQYVLRGAQETGRGYVWPRVLESILDSPLTGVGASNALWFIPERNKYLTPHNGFLFIAATAGIIPLIFYTAYWIQAIWAAIKEQGGRSSTASFLLPMVAFVFIISLSSNVIFMGPLVVVTIAATVASRITTLPAPPRVVRSKRGKKGSFR